MTNGREDELRNAGRPGSPVPLRAGLLALLFCAACAATPVRVSERRPAEFDELLASLAASADSRAPAGEAAARDGELWNPAYFDELLPSDSLSVKGLRRRHRRYGVGVPVTGLRYNETAAAEGANLYPPEGVTRPLTAVRWQEPGGEETLRLYDPGAHPSLAADFTAPYALLLSRTRFGHLRFTGVFRAERMDERTAVVLLEPYDPDRIPLLMVHGLVSSPITWRELSNEVFGDPELRRRYQVWHYVYPTGVPYLHAAATFREKLSATLQRLDPEDDDFASRNLVIVAHSMGGLLTKTLASDSGDRLWRQAFRVPPSGLRGRPEDVAHFERFLFFESDPRLRRVIFIATPHRGSSLADNPLARLVSRFVRLPDEEDRAFRRLLEDNRDQVREDFRRTRSRLPAGSVALSAKDPFIGVFGDLPIREGLPFHTILGQRGDDSDGVVSHASSRQHGAESELVVRDANHGVHESEEAIAETKRILLLHGAAAEGAERVVSAEPSD